MRIKDVVETWKFKILLFVFFIPLITCIFTISILGTHYWYDEIIVTDISRRSIEEILKITLSEPHPLGFYLLLKIMPVANPVLVRSTIITIGYSLISITLIWGWYSGVIRKFKLYSGFLLLLTSPFWIDTVFNIRQSSITVPLLILSLLIFLAFLVNRKDLYIYLLFILSGITFLFGYINFFKVLAIFIVAVLIKKSKSSIFLSIFIILILLGYWFNFGVHQFNMNKERFGWTEDMHQGIVTTLYSSSGGFLVGELAKYFGDIIFISNLFFLFYFLNSKKSKFESLSFFIFILTVLIYIYVLELPRNRYSAELFIFYFMLIGWGLDRLLNVLPSKYKKPLFIIVIILNLTNSIGNIVLFSTGANSYFQNSTFIVSNFGDSPTGIVDSHPIEAFVRKIGHFPDDENLIPVHPFNTAFIKNERFITEKVLFLDGKFDEKSLQEVEYNLSSLQLNRFLYLGYNIDTWGRYNNAYDSKQIALKALSNICEDINMDFIKLRYIIIFDNCL